MQTDTAPRGRRIRWALGVSLAVNLLLIGALAGAAYRHAGGPGMRGGEPGALAFARPYVQALPRDDRRAMRQQIRAQGMPTRESRRAAYEQMLTALRAETFDLAAVRAVLDSQRAAGVQVETTAQAAWLERIAAMDPGTRAAYADQLETFLRRGPHRSKHRD